MADATLPNEDDFWAFARQVPVASRDADLGPIQPWGTQRELVRVIFESLAAGVHQILCVKSGQCGASLIMQLLTLYWMLRFPGLQGAFTCDADDNHAFFRDNLTSMSNGALKLPSSPVATAELTMNNRHQMAWGNGSRLFLNIASKRRSERLGVGRGFAFGHCTEMGLWQNPAALTYLRTRFSDAHPARLFVMEGTPRGRNWLYDLWEEADRSTDIAVAFLGWWMKETNAFARDTAEFKRYWDNRLTLREQRWSKAILTRYKRHITPEQWAWRRWFEAEKAGGDARTAEQEQGTLPESAFESTGVSFLGLEALRVARRTVAASSTPEHYRYEFGAKIEDTQLKATLPARAALEVWEQPQDAIGYVVSAVTARSSTAECSDHIATVWRADRDWIEQVAEFALDEEACGTQQFAWVVIQLVASYRVMRRSVIMEIAGAGMGTLQETQRLIASGWGTARRPAVLQLLGGGLPHYIWRRADSMSIGGALQWKSSPELRTWLYNRLRDQVGNGSVLIRSAPLLAELERIRQMNDQFIPEGRVAGDHRVVSAAMAVEAWSRQLRPMFERTQGASRSTSVHGRLVDTFFDQLRAGALHSR